jgi:hypothetical protein
MDMEETNKTPDVNEELIPMKDFKEMMRLGIITPTTTEEELSKKLDEEFSSYINSDDEEIKDAVSKHNKKTLDLLTDHRESIDKDLSATDKDRVRYDRETWYYLRHKDTIDKYDRKTRKNKAKTGDEDIVVEKPEDDIIREGMAKLSFIVWFDMFLTCFKSILYFPFYLIRELADLFFKMKKSLAITVLIIFGIIVLTVGLIFGIDAIMRLARASS